jgi:hypothetical protein
MATQDQGVQGSSAVATTTADGKMHLVQSFPVMIKAGGAFFLLIGLFVVFGVISAAVKGGASSKIVQLVLTLLIGAIWIVCSLWIIFGGYYGEIDPAARTFTRGAFIFGNKHFLSTTYPLSKFTHVGVKRKGMYRLVEALWDKGSVGFPGIFFTDDAVNARMAEISAATGLPAK